MLFSRLSEISVTGEAQSFNYSNFGYATLGLVLESVYSKDYATLVNILP
jgi:CubicO group peptidase (beta-lactamase class C family)